MNKGTTGSYAQLQMTFTAPAELYAAKNGNPNEQGDFLGNAGTKDDNISVTTGLGRIIQSMVVFAANDSVDVTMHDVIATLQTKGHGQSLSDGEWIPSDQSAEFKYANGAAGAGGYENVNGTTPPTTFTVDEGWSRLNITQRRNAEGLTPVVGNPIDFEIDGKMNAAFTGEVIVNLTNDPIGQLSINKTVEGTGADIHRQFTFTITLTFKEGMDVAETYPYQVVSDGDYIMPMLGELEVVQGENNHTMTLKLPHGQKAIVLDLPDDITYTVTESHAPGYQASYVVNAIPVQAGQPATGVIMQHQPSTVAVINTFVAVAGLPMTGGRGTAARIIGIGVLVLLLSGLVWRMANKRHV
ncbi:DUF7601 domain-containing protein [Bifidobacterium pullorum]|nr:DUF5979 domain-containing protein [Bifidobacterium pullorum]